MKSFRRAIRLLLIVLLLPDYSFSKEDSNKFLARAMQDGIAEIQLCELALKKSSNNDVKRFAQRMIVDHQKINQDVEQLAKKKNVPLPAQPSAEQKATYQELSGLSGKEFDKAFADHNVKDHEKDVKEFKQQAQEETDPDIKAFAERALRVLTRHLQLAKELKSKVASE